MRKLLLPAATAAALLAIAPMTAASAASHSVLTISKVGGTNVKVGATLQAGLKSGTKATFSGGSVSITCPKVTFKDVVTKNPSSPGTATEKLVKQTFSSCLVKGITGAKTARVTLTKLPWQTTVTSKGVVTVKPAKGSNTTIVIKTILSPHPLVCIYLPTFGSTKGSASNTKQTITFTGQKFKLKSGVGECPKKGSFTAAFGPVVDTSVKGSPHVFVN